MNTIPHNHHLFISICRRFSMDPNYLTILESYYDEYKDSMYCTYTANEVFHWYDDKTKLWTDVNFYPYVHNHFIEFTRRKKMYNFHFAKRSLINAIHKELVVMFSNQSILQELDSKMWLIPVKNGIVDMKTGELRERTIEDKFTFELNVIWEGLDYDTKVIDEYMQDITKQSKKLQKYLGYFLATGETDRVLIFQGIGSTGKSIFCNSLYRLLKQFICFDLHKFCHGYRKNSFRLVIIREEIYEKVDHISSHPSIWISYNEEHSEIIRAEYKYSIENSLTKKKVSDTEIDIIYFTTQFMGEEFVNSNNKNHKPRDPFIGEKLKKHFDQLLVWLVKGAVSYHNHLFPQEKEFDFVLEI